MSSRHFLAVFSGQRQNTECWQHDTLYVTATGIPGTCYRYTFIYRSSLGCLAEMIYSRHTGTATQNSMYIRTATSTRLGLEKQQQRCSVYSCLNIRSTERSPRYVYAKQPAIPLDLIAKALFRLCKKPDLGFSPQGALSIDGSDWIIIDRPIPVQRDPSIEKFPVRPEAQIGLLIQYE